MGDAMESSYQFDKNEEIPKNDSHHSKMMGEELQELRRNLTTVP
jgi:hypothetical protein